MAPVYSKTGCVTCKRRRKKCDEVKPVCGGCSRLGLSCQYGQSSAQVQPKTSCTQIGVFELRSPSTESQLLPVFKLRSDEITVLAHVPPSVVAFFTPAADAVTRDVKVLMQLTLTDPTIRNAIVACFSSMLPSPEGESNYFNCISFGKALQSVRSQISDLNVADEQLISLRIAMQFLGLMDVSTSAVCEAKIFADNGIF